MKFSHVFFYILLLCYATACSTDDVSDNNIIPVSIYGKSNNDHAHVTISNKGIVTKYILNDELQLDSDTDSYLRISDKSLFFYSPFNQDTGIRQKNLVTGAIVVKEKFCLSQLNDSFVNVGGNDDVLFKIIASNENMGNGSVYLDVYDTQSEVPCSRINVSKAPSRYIDRSVEAEIYDTTILVKYKSENKNYLTVVDLITKQVVKEFVFNTAVYTAFVLKKEIYIATAFSEYKVYNLSDFSFKRDIILKGNSESLGLDFGLIHPNVYKNQIAANLTVPQPTPMVFVPAIIDNENGKLIDHIDYLSLRDLNYKIFDIVIQDLKHDRFEVFNDIKIDLASKTLILTYPLSNSAGLVVYADYDGNLLSYIEVPVNPQRIIVH